jgi:hypothetical protein
MSKSERYRARAEEAERLASLVSYGRDKERLIAQATEPQRLFERPLDGAGRPGSAA